jgi:thiol-disulfide isomerase/thioredoxin
MNKRLIVVPILLLIVIAAATYLVQNKGTDKPAAIIDASTRSATEPASDKPAEPKSDNATITPQASPGKYVDYTSSIISETKGTKLLFFHAPWCSQCKKIEADIRQTTLPNNVTVIKIDYDTNQSLRQKYGVTLQTTFVRVDDNGNLVEKFVAYDSPSWKSVSDQLL